VDLGLSVLGRLTRALREIGGLFRVVGVELDHAGELLDRRNRLFERGCGLGGT